MDTATTSELIDVSAEETCPAPSILVPRSEETEQATAPQRNAERIARLPPVATFAGQQTAAARAASAPSAETFELMDRLEALARDVAENGGVANDAGHEGAENEDAEHRDTSAHQRLESIPEAPDLSPGLPLIEPTITVSPRPAGFEDNPFLSDKARSRGGAKTIVAGFVMAALVGGVIAFAWPSGSIPVARAPAPSMVVSTVPSTAATVAQAEPIPPAAAPVPAAAPANTAPAKAGSNSAPSPDLVKQLDAITQDLASVRRGVEELTAKQQQIAAAQQKLEQLAAKQEQLAAKQDQMAQSVAKLQSLEQVTRQKTSPAAPHRAASVPPPPPPSRAVSIQPRVPPEQAAQLPPPARPTLHPVPPMPVPP